MSTTTTTTRGRRPIYTEAERAEILEDAQRNGVYVAARRYNVSDSTIYNWFKKLNKPYKTKKPKRGKKDANGQPASEETPTTTTNNLNAVIQTTNVGDHDAWYALSRVVLATDEYIRTNTKSQVLRDLSHTNVVAMMQYALERQTTKSRSSE